MDVKKILRFLCLCAGILSVPGMQAAKGQEAAAGDDGRLVFGHVFAPSEGLVNRTERPFRDEICLNGYWDFYPVPLPADYVYGSGIAPGLPMPDESGWDDIPLKVPSPWNVNAFAYMGLEGPDHRNYPSYPDSWNDVKMAWMRKTAAVPQRWDGSRIILHFEAVAGFAEVYVNGVRAGENFDLFLPFSMDITELVTPGGNAEILVGVRSQSLFEETGTVGRRIVPAGSMWGSHINGIWQDVYLQSVPEIFAEDVFVKPLVSRGMLEIDVTVANRSGKDRTVSLSGNIYEWINLAGTDVLSAPVPAWETGKKAMEIPPCKITVRAGETASRTISVPVGENTLKYWSPETPNLYALMLDIGRNKSVSDRKYVRFGWREWTIEGNRHCLNGKPYELRGDSWHFMGIPQMTRRYAWAWFRAVKDMNGNAVRPHAQVYPRFYLDMADEMGICVLDETANWASDGGPKLDSEHFWEASREHLTRFVKRDRNHPAVFGWSVSNENKPVILYVFNRPGLMPRQMQAWEEWRDIVREIDPTRPWISSDGEDDGDGILPVAVGHYGDGNSMARWKATGKPWGIGEHSMAYYGTPEQVSKYNGERAYESCLGRMEGLANECYGLIASQRREGASYSTVFNMVWYALKPLPFGKRDISRAPAMDDGIHFGEFIEGVPGVQPERIGPYSSTLNPGYDPSLPLYKPWPMFDAMRAANAPDGPAWSQWECPVETAGQSRRKDGDGVVRDVMYVGRPDSSLKRIMDMQGVVFQDKVPCPAEAVILVDAGRILTEKERAEVMEFAGNGAMIWLWGLVPETLDCYNGILPLPIGMDCLKRSSFIPSGRSWTSGLANSDFYFCELQRGDACEYTLKGPFVEEGKVLAEACRTDWRAWNRRAEELKTAAVLRSENECTASLPVFVENGNYVISTITDFADTGKGFRTLSAILGNAGIRRELSCISPDEIFFMQEGRLVFPEAVSTKITDGVLRMYVYSPRPLDDLLTEPDMPKLSLLLNDNSCKLVLNGKPRPADKQDGNGTEYHELPLQQGWNCLEIRTGTDSGMASGGCFECVSRPDFLHLLQITFTDPERDGTNRK